MVKNYALLPEALTMYTQTKASKEVKDMSRSLVSGDFEREYRGDMGDNGGKRQKWCVNALAVAVAVLGCCLVALVVTREVQIAGLRRDVDELTVNMLAMSASIKILDQKLSNNKLFNEFKSAGDTIYADMDQGEHILVEDTKDLAKDKSNNDSLEKLNVLTTVLEGDDDLEDDEYDNDDDDAESGDWYPDYDARREKIGTTNMVKLKPEDFTGAVVKVGKEKQSSSAVIREIKRLLNENPENPDIVLPTLQPSSDGTRSKRSVFPVAVDVDEFAAPKIIGKVDTERRKTKKFVPSSESAITKVATNTVSRTTRNSEDEDLGNKRPFIAAHFHGNTTHLNPEKHEHYKGNGLVRVAHEAAHDVWYPSPWTLASPHPRPTLTRNGHIHVHHTGVYLVYVQIYYLDTHDVISWVLHRTNADIDGRDTLLQCAQSSHSSERLEKPNSCFSASALFLKAGDRLAVRNTGGDRHSLMQPEKSFIGLVKLADAEDPNQEF